MDVTLSLLCIVAGAAAAIQGGLNRRISDIWGKAPAILTNGVVLTIAAALAVWWAGRSTSWFAGIIGPKADAFSRPQWWYILPGVLGFGFLMTIPGAIAKLGATQVFVLIVAGQLLAGLAWDRYVEGMPPGVMRMAGVGIVCFGAWVSTR